MKSLMLLEKVLLITKETSDSPDLTTSVTIVIVFPNMKQSKWIDLEIEYCLKDNTRKDRTSHTNGVVGVIMKHNGGYSWFKSSHVNSDGCTYITYDETKVYDIINNNRFNQPQKQYCCNVCKTVTASVTY